ncbi:unnamed protein product [Caenorhabditis brenneri]
MLTTLFICLCIPIVIHADSITTTSNSTSVEPVFSIEDELKKIASFCLTWPGLQELTGNIIGRIPATFFAETLIDSANMLISLEELRSSLGFPPAGPWTHKREPTDNDTLEEYFESEVYYKDVSLDSKWFHEKNLPPAISFLDKHLPEVRQIHRHVYAEKMRAYEGKLIDKGAVDDMISKYREVRLKMFDPTSKLMSNLKKLSQPIAKGTGTLNSPLTSLSSFDKYIYHSSSTNPYHHSDWPLTIFTARFLSIHSEFFEKLFNSSFKEKSQSTIVIKDVDASEFSNFLSLIYPNQVEITVETVAKYLVLADQYIMLAVTQKCEEFLLQNKRVKTIQKIVFSDQHHLHKLLRETLASVDSREELDSLTMLPEFSMLSDSTKAALLHKYMHFIN